LTYVSGIGPVLAKNIIEYRNQNGPFKTRRELNKVSRLGPKAFEQAAGFLRIRDAAIRWTPAPSIQRITHWSTAWLKTWTAVSVI